MVWEKVKDNPRKWSHWPNPLTNMVKKIDVLACENTWQAKVEMWAIGLANFFWTNFIPSPVELTRKVTMGGYKCGFYLPIEVKSPLDIVWKDGRTSQVLLEISRPITTALFYWWAAETAWDALSTFSSLLMKEELCDLDKNEVLLRDGDLLIPGSLHDFDSGAALYEEIYDPDNRYEGAGYFIGEQGFQSVTAHAFGYFDGGPRRMENVVAGFMLNSILVATKSFGTIAAGTIVQFDLDFPLSQT